MEGSLSDSSFHELALANMFLYKLLQEPKNRSRLLPFVGLQSMLERLACSKPLRSSNVYQGESAPRALDILLSHLFLNLHPSIRHTELDFLQRALAIFQSLIPAMLSVRTPPIAVQQIGSLESLCSPFDTAGALSAGASFLSYISYFPFLVPFVVPVSSPWMAWESSSSIFGESDKLGASFDYALAFVPAFPLYPLLSLPSSFSVCFLGRCLILHCLFSYL